jgi:hypothetical protein
MYTYQDKTTRTRTIGSSALSAFLWLLVVSEASGRIDLCVEVGNEAPRNRVFVAFSCVYSMFLVMIIWKQCIAKRMAIRTSYWNLLPATTLQLCQRLNFKYRSYTIRGELTDMLGDCMRMGVKLARCYPEPGQTPLEVQPVTMSLYRIILHWNIMGAHTCYIIPHS